MKVHGKNPSHHLTTILQSSGQLKDAWVAFLRKNFCLETYMFWRDVEEFRIEFSNSTSGVNETAQRKRNAEMRAEARKIWDKYMAPTAEEAVNLTASALKKVKPYI